MQVRCGQCNAGYTLPADRLAPGRRVQFACRHCGERIVVQIPLEGAGVDAASGHDLHADKMIAQPAGAAPRPVSHLSAPYEAATASPAAASLGQSRAAAAPSGGQAAPRQEDARWFVAAPDGSYRKLSEGELAGEIANGEISGDVLCWRKGFGAWLPLRQSDRWAGLFAASPAPLAAASAAALQDAQQAAATADEPGLATAESSEAASAATSGLRPRRRTDVGLGTSGGLTEDGAARTSEPPGAAVEATQAIATADVPVIDDRAVAAAAGHQSRDGHAREMSVAAIAERIAAQPARANSPARVVGVASGEGSQAAVSLPVFRPSRPEPPSGPAVRVRPRLPDRRAQSGVQRAASSAVESAAAAEALRAPARRPESAAPGHGVVPGEASAIGDGRSAAGSDIDGAWAPATDTYVGPRDGFTRRVGDAQDRERLLAMVGAESRAQAELRRWQWIGLGASLAAIVGLAIGAWATVAARRAQQDRAACLQALQASGAEAARRASTAEGRHAAALRAGRAAAAAPRLSTTDERPPPSAAPEDDPPATTDADEAVREELR